MALHSDLPIYAVTRDLTKLVTQAVANMQRDVKFTLGKRLEELCFDLVLDIYRANSADEKTLVIQGMREKIVAIELALRLATDLRRLPRKHYAQAISLTGSIGKQLTGWLKHSESRQMRSRQGSCARAQR